MEHSQWAGHRPSRLPVIFFSHCDSSDIGTLIHPHLTCLATEVLRGGHENRVLEPGPPRAPELASGSHRQSVHGDKGQESAGLAAPPSLATQGPLP